MVVDCGVGEHDVFQTHRGRGFYRVRYLDIYPVSRKPHRFAFKLRNVTHINSMCGGGRCDAIKHPGTYTSDTIVTMVLHPDTITAILNNWGAPKYDGSQDVRPWLRAMEELFRIYGIPPIQMTEMAVKCTDGEAGPVLAAMFEARATEAGVWEWADFKECVIQIEGEFE